MSIYLPSRIYLVSSLISKDFKDIDFRNRFAATLACLSSEESLLQEAFLEFLSAQNDSIKIDLSTSKSLIKFEKERYSFFLSSNLIRLDRNKDLVYTLFYDYLSEGATRMNKFIYIHNYVNHPEFLFLMYIIGLISRDDYRVAKYITAVSLSLTEVREISDVEYLRNFKEKLERCVLSLHTQLPLDVSHYDPIFTVATN